MKACCPALQHAALLYIENRINFEAFLLLLVTIIRIDEKILSLFV
jgi:hypothetical protein